MSEKRSTQWQLWQLAQAQILIANTTYCVDIVISTQYIDMFAKNLLTHSRQVARMAKLPKCGTFGRAVFHDLPIKTKESEPPV